MDAIKRTVENTHDLCITKFPGLKPPTSLLFNFCNYQDQLLQSDRLIDSPNGSPEISSEHIMDPKEGHDLEEPTK